jgi:hypothetical protein
MMRLSRALTRPGAAGLALRNSRGYVMASQTHRAQEATVSLGLYLGSTPARMPARRCDWKRVLAHLSVC